MQLIKEWNIKQSSKTDKAVIFGVAALLLVFFILISPLTTQIFVDLNPFLWGIYWIAIVVAVVVLHELLHGMFFWLYSKRVQFGVKWGKLGMTPYATSKGARFSKKQFEIIAFAPQFLTISLFVLSAVSISNATISIFALMAGATNLAGGCADIYSAIKIARYPMVILVEDTGDGYRIWQ